MPGARTRFGGFNQHHLGRLLFKSGRLDEAIAALKLSVDIAAETMPGTPNAAMFSCWLASAQLAAGRLAEAQATLAAVPAADLSMPRPEIQTTRAEFFAAQGDGPSALAQAQAAMEHLLAVPTMRFSHLMLRCAAAALTVGDGTTALRWIGRLRQHLARGQLDSSPVLADAHWVAARAHAAQGHAAEAAQEAQDAVRRWRLFDAHNPRLAQTEAARAAFGAGLA